MAMTKCWLHAWTLIADGVVLSSTPITDAMVCISRGSSKITPAC